MSSKMRFFHRAKAIAQNLTSWHPLYTVRGMNRKRISTASLGVGAALAVSAGVAQTALASPLTLWPHKNQWYNNCATLNANYYGPSGKTSLSAWAQAQQRCSGGGTDGGYGYIYLMRGAEDLTGKGDYAHAGSPSEIARTVKAYDGSASYARCSIYDDNGAGPNYHKHSTNCGSRNP
jgi:hypothetical protein